MIAIKMKNQLVCMVKFNEDLMLWKKGCGHRYLI